MVDKRNRTDKLVEFTKKLGIEINIGKNKAFGNKGVFKAKNHYHRIDVAKNLTEEDTLRVLIHELIHYIHFNYDKTLKSVDFIFNNNYSVYEEDLLKLTVESVPKDFASELFSRKASIKQSISSLSNSIKDLFPDIKLSDKNNKLKKEISKSELKYLLKYDRVKILKGFSTKIYSIDNLKTDFPDIKEVHLNYLKLCSYKRKLNNINSKISRLNKYYNSPSELIARSFEFYFLNPEYMQAKTPKLYQLYEELIKQDRVKYLNNLVNIINNTN